MGRDRRVIVSMTGFAALTGAEHGFSWAWDMRSVNAKGLDIRSRMPDWANPVDVAVRKAIKANLSRGNVTVNLRVQREDGAENLSLDMDQVTRVLKALRQIEGQATEQGVTLSQSKASDVLTQKGVMMSAQSDAIPDGLLTALIKDFDNVLVSFTDMRKAEGAALHGVVDGQLQTIADLVAQASDLIPGRDAQTKAGFQTALARVMDNTDGHDPERITQELALIAVKSDVTEELDRLRAHVTAARDLLNAGGPCGRKLDFLCQEFNREANTLCSKSGSTELTAVGLELKVTIDQMREQIQNVE